MTQRWSCCRRHSFSFSRVPRSRKKRIELKDRRNVEKMRKGSPNDRRIGRDVDWTAESRRFLEKRKNRENQARRGESGDDHDDCMESITGTARPGDREFGRNRFIRENGPSRENGTSDTLVETTRIIQRSRRRNRRHGIPSDSADDIDDMQRRWICENVEHSNESMHRDSSLHRTTHKQVRLSILCEPHFSPFLPPSRFRVFPLPEFFFPASFSFVGGISLSTQPGRRF